MVAGFRFGDPWSCVTKSPRNDRSAHDGTVNVEGTFLRRMLERCSHAMHLEIAGYVSQRQRPLALCHEVTAQRSECSRNNRKRIRENFPTRA
jgi:hypothetical protein